MVTTLTAMQAQEFVPAKWAIAQRAGDIAESAVDTAFAAGEFLRTHVLRPTWHFVAAQDVSWLLALTAPRVHQLNAYYYRKFGLTDEVFTTSETVFRSALAGGHQTRAELAPLLAAAGLPTTGLPPTGSGRSRTSRHRYRGSTSSRATTST